MTKDFKYIVLGVAVFIVTFWAYQAYADYSIDIGSGVTSVIETGGAGGGDTQKVAGKFTTSDAGVLDNVDFRIRRRNSPTDGVKLELFASNGTTGTGVALATSEVLDYTELTGSCESALVNFVFTDEYELEEDTEYWIAVSRTGSTDSTNNYTICGESSGGSNQISVYNGSWTAAGYSEYQIEAEIFIIGEGEGEPPATTTPQLASQDAEAVNAQSQTIANGIYIFLLSFALIIFYFKRYD